MANRLTIVIATHKRPRLLKRTLDSLALCSLPAIYEETVVVENGARAGAKQIVEDSALRGVRYTYWRQASKSCALNAVLKDISDGLVCFFDDDVRIARGTVQAYADAAGGLDRACVLGGPVDVDYDVPPPPWLTKYLPHSAAGWKPSRDANDMAKMVFLGGNWATFAEDLRASGGFDPTRGPVAEGEGLGVLPVGEETEAQRRLYEGGAKDVYVPEAMVWHYVPRERCSKEWALVRAYRHGVSSGLTGNREGWPQVRGWMIRKWIEKCARWIVTRSARDEEVRFRASYEFQQVRGLIQGHRVASGMRDDRRP